jgi:hypothetical protein
MVEQYYDLDIPIELFNFSFKVNLDGKVAGRIYYYPARKLEGFLKEYGLPIDEIRWENNFKHQVRFPSLEDATLFKMRYL